MTNLSEGSDTSRGHRDSSDPAATVLTVVQVAPSPAVLAASPRERTATACAACGSEVLSTGAPIYWPATRGYDDPDQMPHRRCSVRSPIRP